MTLGELRDAIAALLEAETIDENDSFGIELCGYQLDATSITVVVSSQLWEDGMVVISADYLELEEGEADDG